MARPSRTSTTLADTVDFPKTPRTARGKARVETLKAAGSLVFAERGYDAATMTEIAARAPASIGTLYQFFPTKESLASAIHDELIETMSAMLDSLGNEAQTQTGSESIDLLFTRLSEFIEQHPAFSVLSQRRDIAPQKKLDTRTRMRRQIGALLSRTTTPLSPQRCETVAVLILEMMKMIVSLGKTDGAKMRNAVASELRAMLTRHLAGE